MPPTKGRRSTAKTTTPKKAVEKKPRSITVVKKDKIVEAVQYVAVNGQLTVTAPTGIKLPKGRYGDVEGSSRSGDINKAFFYRAGDDVMFMQMACGDYAFIKISQMEAVLEKVKTLDITKAPRSRRGENTF